MKWILIVVGVIAGLIALIAIIGPLMPKSHTASRSTVINKSPEVLWQAITDFAAFPQWRTDIKNVEALPDREGHKVWREDGKNGMLTLETIEASPPSRWCSESPIRICLTAAPGPTNCNRPAPAVVSRSPKMAKSITRYFDLWGGSSSARLPQSKPI